MVKLQNTWGGPAGKAQKRSGVYISVESKSTRPRVPMPSGVGVAKVNRKHKRAESRSWLARGSNAREPDKKTRARTSQGDIVVTFEELLG